MQKRNILVLVREITIGKRRRHDLTQKHINNNIKHMESIVNAYRNVKPIEIQHFTLE